MADLTNGIVAIDLGTVCSRLAVWQDGDVVLIPNERGRTSTPSCVAFTQSATLVGDAAKDQVESNLSNTIVAPQRLLGYKVGHPWIQWYMRSNPSQVATGEDGKPLIRVVYQGKELRFCPEDLVAILLKSLRLCAEKYLGREVVDVVMTVPAGYGKVQREAIVCACNQAGLQVRDMVKTPTAAAIARCFRNLDSDPRNMLVCDIGGTYYNYALIRVEGGTFVERAIGTELFDLDMCIARLCVQDLRDKHFVHISNCADVMLRLRRSCEQAKRHLSEHYQACVEVKEIVGSRDYICHVSREQFEALCQEDMENLLVPINWCLEDLGVEKGNVHEAILVGGSARIPRIRNLLRDFFYGMAPAEEPRPDIRVVIGAAVFAASLSDDTDEAAAQNLLPIRVVQVTPWANVGEHEEPETERPSNTLDIVERENSDGIVSFL